MKTARNALLLVSCLTSTISVAYSQIEAPKTKIYRHEAFQIRVPINVSVTKKMPADFDILLLKRGKTILLNAYVGANPSFPSDDAPAGKSATNFKLNGLDAKFLRWQDGKGRCYGETLVAIHQDWADVIHFFYSDLSEKDAAVTEAIIRSVTLNQKKASKEDKETFVPVN